MSGIVPQGIRSVVPSVLERMPADLRAVIFLALLTDFVALTPVLRDTPLRFILGIPMALFLPGYALLAVIFPERGDRPLFKSSDRADGLDPSEGGDETGSFTLTIPSNTGITGMERVVLSVSLSVIIVPLVGYVFNFTAIGIRFLPMLLAVTGVTIILALLGVYRRNALPSARRFEVPYQTWVGAIYATLFDSTDRFDRSVNIAIVIVILLLIATVGLGVVLLPEQREAYSEAYLAFQEGPTDDLVGRYPSNFTRGDGQTVVLVLENHEGRPQTYTVLIELQRVASTEDSLVIVEREHLLEIRTTLGNNQTVRLPHQLVPTMTGDRLRVQYLIYTTEPPPEPTVTTADYELHLWISVSS